MNYLQVARRFCAAADAPCAAMWALLAISIVAGGGARAEQAAQSENGCAADAGNAVALRAAGRKVPIYVGDPEKQLSIAGYVDWKQLSPKGAPLVIAACFHEGYFQLLVPHLDSCKAQACWIASRWIVTEHAQPSTRVTCHDIPTQNYAAARGLARKCRPD